MAKAKETVMITGGSGFLGINLARHLHERGYAINIIDLVDFDYEDMKDKVKFLRGDIRDRKALMKITRGADYVVHTAAALPLYDPEEIYSTDIEGTRNVLRVAKKCGVKRVVHISSTAVYSMCATSKMRRCLKARRRKSLIVGFELRAACPCASSTK